MQSLQNKSTDTDDQGGINIPNNKQQYFSLDLIYILMNEMKVKG